MKKKGFTLVELLTVVIILGLFMIIAVPSVGKVIMMSRRKAFADSARGYINEVMDLVEEGDIPLEEVEGITYVIPHTCIKLDKKTKFEFGNIIYANILVKYDKNKESYLYYFDSLTDQHYGTYKIESKDLDQKYVVKLNRRSDFKLPGTNRLIKLAPPRCQIP